MPNLGPTQHILLNALLANKKMIRTQDGKLRLKTSMGEFQASSLRALADIMEIEDKAFAQNQEPTTQQT